MSKVHHKTFLLLYYGLMQLILFRKFNKRPKDFRNWNKFFILISQSLAGAVVQQKRDKPLRTAYEIGFFLYFLQGVPSLLLFKESISLSFISNLKTVSNRFFIAVFVCKRPEMANDQFCCKNITFHGQSQTQQFFFTKMGNTKKEFLV